MANFPLYNAILKDETDGITTISFVTNPATEVTALYFGKQEQLVFAEEDKQMITSVVMLAETPIYRRNGDYEYYIQYPKDVLVEMAHKMLKDNTFNTISFEHDGNVIEPGNIELVELYIKDETKPGPFADIKDGSIIATYKCLNKKLWEYLKAHPLSISLEGYFNLEQIKYTKQNKMNKIIKTIMSTLLQYKSVITDKGEAYFPGEELAEGIEILDESGAPLADGEYVIDEENKFEVKDGVIVSVTAPEKEEPKEEPKKEENEDEKDVKIAELEAAVEEKDAKIKELENKIAELEGAATEKETEFTSLNDKFTELNDKFTNVNSELEAANAKIAEFEKQTPETLKDRFAAQAENKINKVSSIAETIKKIKK